MHSYYYFFCLFFLFFFFNDTATTEIYTLSLHDALPILVDHVRVGEEQQRIAVRWRAMDRSEEHTSELQSRRDLVCRLLLEKKKKIKKQNNTENINDTARHTCFNKSAE